MRTRMVTGLVSSLLILIMSAPALAASSPRQSLDRRTAFTVTDLVSDIPGFTDHLDPNLVNAWGLAAGPTSPWWVADNGTDVSTLYSGDGSPIPLVVKVAGAPTGTVFNGGSNFVVSHGGASGPSVFLFATEGGTIRGWNPSVPPPPTSTQSFGVVDRSGEHALYKGLAIASTAGGDFLYAADFHNGRVDMFDGRFHLVTPPGAFVDPTIPSRYAPFGIATIGAVVFVTYAKRNAAGIDDVPGPGHGYVDAFSTSGVFLHRVATRGNLNAPWGLAMAPAEGFGGFSGDLLVGNFGDGRIHAFAPQANGSYTPAGALRGTDGTVLAIHGLWALGFGNDGPAGRATSLFFTAGPTGETHGLFGKIETAG